MMSDGGGWKWIEENGRGSTANSCNTILPSMVRHNPMPDRKDHGIKRTVLWKWCGGLKWSGSNEQWYGMGSDCRVLLLLININNRCCSLVLFVCVSYGVLYTDRQLIRTKINKERILSTTNMY